MPQPRHCRVRDVLAINSSRNPYGDTHLIFAGLLAQLNHILEPQIQICFRGRRCTAIHDHQLALFAVLLGIGEAKVLPFRNEVIETLLIDCLRERTCCNFALHKIHLSVCGKHIGNQSM